MAQDLDIFYPRTSKDKDDNHGIDAQVDNMQSYYRTLTGQELPDSNIFREEASGVTMDRKQLQRLLKLIKEGRVRRVFIHAVDRLSRKSYHARMILEEEIFANGVELHVTGMNRQFENNIQDVMLFGVLAEIAQLERSTIVERLRGGRAYKRAHGEWVGEGRDKFGYTREGRKKDLQFVIVEDQAAIIRNIFYMCLQLNMSCLGIATRLNLEGAITPSIATGHWNKRTTWSKAMVLTILRDEAYTGRFTAQRYRATKSASGKKSSVRDDSRAIHHEFDHLRIIDDETFQRAQERIDAGRVRYLPKGDQFYLMRVRLWCDECYKLTGEKFRPVDGRIVNRGKGQYKCNASTTRESANRTQIYRYYRCNSALEKNRRESSHRDKCPLRQVRADPVDSIVWDWAMRLISDPEKVIAGFEGARQRQLEENSSMLRAIDRGHEEAARLQAEINRYNRLFAIEAIKTEEELLGHVIPLQSKLEGIQKGLDQDKGLIGRVTTRAEITKIVSALVQLREIIMSLDEVTDDIRTRVIDLLDVVGLLGRSKDDRPYVTVVWCGAIQGTLFTDTGQEMSENGGSGNDDTLISDAKYSYIAPSIMHGVFTVPRLAIAWFTTIYLDDPQ